MTPREEQIARLTSTVPCVECQNPDSPFGSHDCERFRRENFAFPFEHPDSKSVSVSTDPAGRVQLPDAQYWAKGQKPPMTPRAESVLRYLVDGGVALPVLDIEDGR